MESDGTATKQHKSAFSYDFNLGEAKVMRSPRFEGQQSPLKRAVEVLQEESKVTSMVSSTYNTLLTQESSVLSFQTKSKAEILESMLKQQQSSYLYVISGFDSAPLGSVERLKLDSGVASDWIDMPPLPVPRTKF